MLWKNAQHSWKGGQFDRAMMGRSDLAKYPEAASVLENFIVKRQGCISKRRGTEEVADLKNILGGEVKPIGIRIIPLVYEKSEGYYVLMTRGRAFLAGKNGIRLMDGSWTHGIDPYELTDYNPDKGGGSAEYTGTKPFSIRKFGYDTLQAAINAALNGDVIKLHQDGQSTPSVTVSAGIGITIDLNGHRLYCSGTTAMLTVNHANAKVTLRNSGADTYEDTDGHVQPVDFRHNAVRNVALVTVTKGTFVLNAAIYGTGTGTSSHGVSVAAAGTFTMNGGSIDVNYNGVTVASGGKATIENGRISSRAQYVVTGGSAAVPITVNNGVFSGYYGWKSYADINGGVWTIEKRAGYSNCNVYGGRFLLKAADFYYSKFPVYRGEFHTEVASTELDACLAQGGAVANAEPVRTVDGVEYAGYRQAGEADYRYDPPVTPGGGGGGGGETVADNSRKPFYVNVPYDDADLPELDYTQSGDIIFLAHRKYPFASLEFEGQGLKYEVRKFSGEEWSRPVVKKVAAASGAKFPTDGAYKTVYYCCTYVKDGVESLPSQAYPFKYRLPWPQTAAVEITVARGANDEEPDYYNIYKKESTDFGLIGTISMNLGIHAKPFIDSTGGETTLVRQGRAWGPKQGQEMEMNASNPEWYLNREKDKLVLGTFLNGSEGWGYQGIGGVRNQGSLAFDFGSNSGVIISRIKLALDGHEFVTTDGYTDIPNPEGEGSKVKPVNKKYVNHFSGRHFKVTLKTINDAGAVKTFEKTADVGSAQMYRVSGTVGAYAVTPVTLVPGANETYFPTQLGIRDAASGETVKQGIDEVEDFQRYLDVDFTEELKSAYPNSSGDTGGASKTIFSVSSITVTAYRDSGTSTPCAVYWHGVMFSSAYGSTDRYEDEYITPDMSITPPSSEDHFSTSGEYPGCAAIYQQRLCLAASGEQPNGFWMSCIGDLYNFDVHSSIREDDAISAEIAATEFPQINHMVMSKGLMLFCDASEWEVAPASGNSLSYKTVSAKMQSGIGCIKSLKPFTVGDEILFVEATGQTLRAIRYNFVSDGYESTDLSVLSQDITRNNPITQMAYQQNPDSLVWCTLEDGTLAVLVYMKEHEMVAWGRHVLGGGFKARGIASSKALYNGTTDVMMLVERGGDYRLWRVRDDNQEEQGRVQVTMDGIRFWTVNGAAGADGDASHVFCGNGVEATGHPFTARMVTTRPENDPRQPVRQEIRNATEVEVSVLNGSSFRVRAHGLDPKYDRTVELEPAVATDGRVTLRTEDVRKTLYGANCRDGRIELTHDGVWPLTVLMMATTYQIELANQTSRETTDED